MCFLKCTPHTKPSCVLLNSQARSGSRDRDAHLLSLHSPKTCASLNVHHTQNPALSSYIHRLDLDLETDAHIMSLHSPKTCASLNVHHTQNPAVSSIHRLDLDLETEMRTFFRRYYTHSRYLSATPSALDKLALRGTNMQEVCVCVCGCKCGCRRAG